MRKQVYKEIPIIEKVSQVDVEENYKKIKEDVATLLAEECSKIKTKYPSSEEPQTTCEEKNEQPAEQQKDVSF